MKKKLIKLKDWFITTFKNKPSNVIVPIFSILNFIITTFLFNIIICDYKRSIFWLYVYKQKNKNW